MDLEKKTADETVRVVVEDDRTGIYPEALSRAFLDHVRTTRRLEVVDGRVHDLPT